MPSVHYPLLIPRDLFFLSHGLDILTESCLSSVREDMLCAPLWDPALCQFVGLLTVTDFIDILRHYQATSQDVGSLATCSIGEIFAHLSFKPQEFKGADSNCSLQQACQLLLSSRSDFLPIVFAEDMRVLSCVTYTTILEHLVTHFREQRRLFDDSVTDLGIGVYGDSVVTTRTDETLSQALAKMHAHSLSALPVLAADGSRTLVGVYSRSDITFLTKASDAEDAVRNLDLPLSDVLASSTSAQQRSDVTTPDAMRTCSPSHTLQAIFESFAQIRFNRLYVIDEKNQELLGVVSAKDLVQYFLKEDD
jgi:5'-AMP-activated protein kinase, regulatory gamma subunit